MKTEHRLKLEKLMDDFINEICEDYDGYYGDNLPINMAKAAELIFDTGQDEQKFAFQQAGYGKPEKG